MKGYLFILDVQIVWITLYNTIFSFLEDTFAKNQKYTSIRTIHSCIQMKINLFSVELNFKFVAAD